MLDEVKPRRLLELREKAHRVAVATLGSAVRALDSASTSEDYEGIIAFLDSANDDCVSCLSLLRADQMLYEDESAGPQTAIDDMYEHAEKLNNTTSGVEPGLPLDREVVQVSVEEISPSDVKELDGSALQNDIANVKEPEVYW